MHLRGWLDHGWWLLLTIRRWYKLLKQESNKVKTNHIAEKGHPKNIYKKKSRRGLTVYEEENGGPDEPNPVIGGAFGCG